MTLVSALEDLHETTLRAVNGCLRKLAYVARLRQGGGTYNHWGLVRVYGESVAEKALGQAHRELLSDVLSTPLRNLEEDTKRSSEGEGISPKVYVDQLSGENSKLLPASPGAGSQRHLSSMLHALSSLLAARKPTATPPAE